MSTTISSIRTVLSSEIAAAINGSNIDFSKIPAGRPLYWVNRLEQVNGRGPTGRVLTPGTPVIKIIIGADPHRVGPMQRDNSFDPATGPLKMRKLPDTNFADLMTRAAKAPTRTWRFERVGGNWVVNGALFDETVVSAAIPQESEEVWVIQNPGGSWRHPVHIHFEEHRVLSRNGVPTPPNAQTGFADVDYGRKDVIALNTNEEVRVFMRFRDMKGRYVMHCHNVVHEDHAMMVRWDIV